MLKRNIAILTIAVVVLGTGAYAWATGAPSRPTTNAGQTSSDQTNGVHPGGGRRMAGRGPAGGPFRRDHRLGGRAIHGDLIVRAKTGFENVSFDRGDDESSRSIAPSVNFFVEMGAALSTAISTR